jgi:hypothetical protein
MLQQNRLKMTQTKSFSQKERWMPNLRQQRANLFSANQ